MDINKAIYILIQGCEIAQSKGAFSLVEAKALAEAIEFIDSVSNRNNKDESQRVSGNNDPKSYQDDGETISEE